MYLERTESSLLTSIKAMSAFDREYSRSRCALTFDFFCRTDRVNGTAEGLNPLLEMPAAVCEALYSLYMGAIYETEEAVGFC